MVMLFNDQPVNNIEATLINENTMTKKAGITKIQFLQTDGKTPQVVGELKLDREKTWTLICHLIRNYSHYYLPSLECANCQLLKPIQDVKCLCKDCIKEADNNGN